MRRLERSLVPRLDDWTEQFEFYRFRGRITSVFLIGLFFKPIKQAGFADNFDCKWVDERKVERYGGTLLLLISV
jgi:hypothetical protein